MHSHELQMCDAKAAQCKMSCHDGITKDVGSQTHKSYVHSFCEMNAHTAILKANRLTCLSSFDQEAFWADGLELMPLCTLQCLHHLALSTSTSCFVCWVLQADILSHDALVARVVHHYKVFTECWTMMTFPPRTQHSYTEQANRNMCRRSAHEIPWGRHTGKTDAKKQLCYSPQLAELSSTLTAPKTDNP